MTSELQPLIVDLVRLLAQDGTDVDSTLDLFESWLGGRGPAEVEALGRQLLWAGRFLRHRGLDDTADRLAFIVLRCATRVAVRSGLTSEITRAHAEREGEYAETLATSRQLPPLSGVPVRTRRRVQGAVESRWGELSDSRRERLAQLAADAENWW